MEKPQAEYYIVNHYPKDLMVCVKTGFSFLHEGFERRGDLFVRPVSGDFCVHGVASALLPPAAGSIYSEFIGEVLKDRGEWSTAAYGVLYLSLDDEAYVQKNCDCLNLDLSTIRYKDDQGW